MDILYEYGVTAHYQDPRGIDMIIKKEIKEKDTDKYVRMAQNKNYQERIRLSKDRYWVRQMMLEKQI